MKIVIEMPIPTRTLSPNGRCHWSKRAKARKEQRTSAHAKALAALRWMQAPKWKSAKVNILWYHQTARWPDADNCLGCCKGILDGLVDAGVLADDRGVQIGMIFRSKDATRPRVEIEVEAI